MFRFASLLAAIIEGLVCVYLLLCLWIGDDQRYSSLDPAHKLKVLIYAIVLPVGIIRIVACLVFRSQ